MPGPYSTEFFERDAVRLLKSGHILLKDDGTLWRVKHAGTGRSIEPPTRCDYGKRHKSVKYYDSSGDIHSVPVQRLVWQYCKGDIPEGLTVNHKDGDPTNNRIDNLELLTQSEQHLHRYRVLGHKSAMTLLVGRLEALTRAAQEAVETGSVENLRVFLERA